MAKVQSFSTLDELAQYFREELDREKTDEQKETNFILLYAYNGTGKTRLSTVFKDQGKTKETIRLVTEDGDALVTEDGDALVSDEIRSDTLYFNAYTEDLFSWDNDLEGDQNRVLKLNADSKFFAGLADMEMDTRIRPLLDRYADFEFKIDTEKWEVSFSREVFKEGKHKTEENIKISRGEENLFIWCFFLAIVQLALDDDGNGPYNWVKYIYIDDPISSLDEQNAIAVATHLARLLKAPENKLKTVISTHHMLFFNVLWNELKKHSKRCFLSRERSSGKYMIRNTGDTPFFHHVAALAELYEVERSGDLRTHHFNMLRAILEKTASFHGYDSFSACVRQDDSDVEGVLHSRVLNLLSHGNYSLYEPREMLEDNKELFRKILHDFINRYPFNPVLFPEAEEATTS